MIFSHSIRPFAFAAVSVLAVGCGGGGEDTPSAVSDPIAAPGDEPDPCTAEIPSRLVGTYLGSASYDATVADGAYCTWMLRLTVRGERSGTACALSALAEGDVEQGVFPAADGPLAAECAPIDAQLDLRTEPAGTSGDVQIRFFNIAPAPDAGPYVADPDQIARRINLFGGTVPAIDYLVLSGDGVIRLAQRNPSTVERIEGTLERTVP